MRKFSYILQCDNPHCKEQIFPWVPIEFITYYLTARKRKKCPKCGKYMKFMGTATDVTKNSKEKTGKTKGKSRKTK